MGRASLASLLLLTVACNGARSTTAPSAAGESEASGKSAAAESEASGEPAAAQPELADAGGAGETNVLRVATYNVNFGMAGDRETLELIRSLDADVVFLQETNEKWERAIRRALGSTFAHMKFRHHSWPAGGQAVLSRHPFGDEAWVRARAGHFPAWKVVLESPLGALQVLSVHLDPPVLQAKKRGWLAAYQQSQEVHVRELTAHVEHLDPALPTLVVGDFNEDVKGKGVAWMRERGFSPAIDEFVPTWQWQTRRGTIRWQLDHMLCGEGLRFVEAAVVDGGNSDHQPLVAAIATASPTE